MKPCALIPAFNEEERIGQVVAGASRHVTKVIVVDDGSVDGTARVAREAGAEVVTHSRNLGKGASLRDGLTKAFAEGFDPVIVLDGDAQHDWDEIPLFLEADRGGRSDIIVGDRMGRAEGMPLIRYLTNRVTSFFVSKLAKQRIPDSQCGYRLIHRSAFQRMEFSTMRYDTEAEMLIEAARAGCRIGSIPVKTIYGSEKSRIDPVRDTVRFIKLVMRHMRKSPVSGRNRASDE
ncbi:MAG: glycosyltransferase family 2 protein [Candidatus Aureabacteria bacterium]|nr:glycosyltransferase family 2 protein [Candidatus Auribacterota bacterium]